MVFDGVEEFIAVVETGAFYKAAQRLAVSTSHVSRKVNALEDRIKTRLMVRNTRSVRLTEAGRVYYNQCIDAVNTIKKANESFRNEQLALKGSVKVSAAGEFAESFVAPALLEFAALHPEIALHIDYNSRFVDFIEEDIDFAIRYGDVLDPGLVARPLVKRQLIAIASEKYLDNYGVPQHPEDLKQHLCIITNNNVWTFQSSEIPFKVKVTGRIRVNSIRNVVGAVEAGLGIAYVPRSSLGDCLSKLTLKPVLEPYWTKDLTSSIVYSEKKFLPLRSRECIKFLLDQFSDWQE